MGRSQSRRAESARVRRAAAGEGQPLADCYFTPRDVAKKAFEDAIPLDFKSFREDIDAYVDPTPREWFES